MARAVVGMGGNLGSRRAIFDCALRLLAAAPGCSVLARSSLYATPPLGPPQPDYLNAALLVEWVGAAESLLSLLRHVELLLGRERRVRWGARTLDLDLLWWSEGAVETPFLHVPHPELTRRNFALAPLLDVLPELGPRYGALLDALGRPARARPGWAAVQGADARFRIEGASDDDELAALLVSAVVQCGRVSVTPSTSLPFFMRGGRAREVDALLGLARALAQSGFVAAGAAVFERGSDSLRGVLIGSHGHDVRLPLVVACSREASPGDGEVSGSCVTET
jgi:2-amino-4-hydroxy-6-hydroxymethyldihydropteridine diphosphokinase